MSLFNVVSSYLVEDRLNLSDTLKLNLGVVRNRLHLFHDRLNSCAQMLKFGFQAFKIGPVRCVGHVFPVACNIEAVR